MESNKKYWKGLEELNNSPEFVDMNKSEFAEPLPIEEVLSGAGLSAKTPRRDFLKALGFGVGAVTLAACQKVPVHNSIPYLIKPEEVTPGIPNYYTSSYNGQGILVKTREGRPIKLEGNPEDLIGHGSLSAQGQASVLDLYEVTRLQSPLLKGDEISWDAADDFVKRELAAVAASGKKIRIVSSTVRSPSTKAVIAEFATKFPTTKLVNYDPISYTGIIQGNQNSFGKAVLPHYHFEKADVIVSFNADFLGTWISPVEYMRQWVSNRNNTSLQNKKMSRHIQFEAGMTMTGTNADTRIPIKPSEEGLALINLYNALSGTTLPGSKALSNKSANTAITLVAKELLAAKGRSLVVCGCNDVAMQVLVNAINSLLGSYGTTIDLDNPSYQYAGNDAEFVEFINEMKHGEVGAVFFMDANPAYNYFNSKDFTAALAKVPLKVSLSDRNDETSSLCNVVAAKNHYLESWGDDNAFAGYYTIVQPTISPVYNTRQAEQSLLIWSGNTVNDYYSFVKNNWETNLLPSVGLSGQAGWETLLQKGVIKTADLPVTAYTFNKDLNGIAQNIINRGNQLVANGSGAVELQVYETVNMGDGTKANNPWLQELPEPVTKVTWDNFVAIGPKFAEKLGINEGSILKVSSGNHTMELPALLQPGQAPGTISVALGYGRTLSGKVGTGVGKNAFPFFTFKNGTFQQSAPVSISTTGGEYILAQTQTHHSVEGRNIIRETTFDKYVKDPSTVNGRSESEHKTYTLWPEYNRPEYNWVMAIDLNSCTGCGACVVACNVENNVPVVGRDEVRRRREMLWIRIDRYYSFKEGDENLTEEREIDKLDNLDNVSVVHQPMLCQHCDHAPCETVCPVLATVHSSDGLNYMAYNRCVGTRYCANNCPYKVRRFNWFNYWNDSRFDNYLNNEHVQLVLNPDVTTRFRGVMEKCTMCVQRIQGGKLKAKLDQRSLKDGDVKTACQQTCPTNAIIFGNVNDPESEVAKALKSDRTYYVLEELNTEPGIGYQVKVRNVHETLA